LKVEVVISQFEFVIIVIGTALTNLLQNLGYTTSKIVLIKSKLIETDLQENQDAENSDIM
jgi:hypothetical protein